MIPYLSFRYKKFKKHCSKNRFSIFLTCLTGVTLCVLPQVWAVQYKLEKFAKNHYSSPKQKMWVTRTTSVTTYVSMCKLLEIKWTNWFKLKLEHRCLISQTNFVFNGQHSHKVNFSIKLLWKCCYNFIIII